MKTNPLRSSQMRLHVSSAQLHQTMRRLAEQIQAQTETTKTSFITAFYEAFPHVKGEVMLQSLDSFDLDEPGWVLNSDLNIYLRGIGDVYATNRGWHPDPHSAKRVDERWADIGVTIATVDAMVERFNASGKHSITVDFSPFYIQTAADIQEITCPNDVFRFLADVYPAFEVQAWGTYSRQADALDDLYCVAGQADGEPIFLYGSGETAAHVDTIMARPDLLHLKVPGVIRQLPPDPNVPAELMVRISQNPWYGASRPDLLALIGDRWKHNPYAAESY